MPSSSRRPGLGGSPDHFRAGSRTGPIDEMKRIRAHALSLLCYLRVLVPSVALRPGRPARAAKIAGHVQSLPAEPWPRSRPRQRPSKTGEARDRKRGDTPRADVVKPWRRPGSPRRSVIRMPMRRRSLTRRTVIRAVAAAMRPPTSYRRRPLSSGQGLDRAAADRTSTGCASAAVAAQEISLLSPTSLAPAPPMPPTPPRTFGAACRARRYPLPDPNPNRKATLPIVMKGTLTPAIRRRCPAWTTSPS